MRESTKETTLEQKFVKTAYNLVLTRVDGLSDNDDNANLSPALLCYDANETKGELWVTTIPQCMCV